MKKLITIALLVAAANLGYSQGTVNFNTAQSANSTIKYAAGTTLGGASGTKIDGSAHPTAQAAIYAGAAGSTEAQLVFVAPASGFASGATAGYITLGSVTIPFLAQGAGAVIQIRAWDALTSTASTYAQALTINGAYVGKSQLYNISSLGGPGDPNNGIPPATPATIPSQVGFSIAPVPEPSTIALGFLGLGGLLFWRRKK
jgi:hypothetical protein